MGRKYFVHPGAVVADGRAVCTCCGRELPVDEQGIPVLETGWPCTVSLPIPFDDEVAVSVWDCRARVLYRGRLVDCGKLPGKLAAELKRLAVESVENAGGAINWSGIYPPSDELCEFVKRLKDSGYV